VTAFIEAGRPTPELQVILSELEARGLAGFVTIDYRVIRGLAYYTGPVFEAFDKKGQFRAIAGGGRYDQLVGLLSGGKVDLPGLGFGMGDVVLAELLRSRGLVPSFREKVDVVVLIEDEALRGASLRWVQELRNGGTSVDFALELGANYTARVEPGAAEVRLKDLRTRNEQVMSAGEARELVWQGARIE
jgi:histidyl-tRNA synthetase